LNSTGGLPDCAGGSDSAGGLNSLDPPWAALKEMVSRAVSEDLPNGDPTGAAVGPRPASASIVNRQPGTISGLVTAQLVLDEVSNRLGTGAATAVVDVADGARVKANSLLGTFNGPADTLLAAERTLLNILSHLSGIATATAAVLKEVAGTGAVVRDTRKTLPGLRAAEKYAVRCGGGQNHRMDLSSALLVKDNHIAALGGVKAAIEAVRIEAARTEAARTEAARTEATHSGSPRRPDLTLEVEVDNLDELDEALWAGAELVLVDNMSLADTEEAVRRAVGHGAKVEASGGLHLGNVKAVAGTGVHYVAIGGLTHSSPALDIGLDWAL
jgi:nicotinate-nucleotide pyrophosphorylase (carboxylating)